MRILFVTWRDLPHRRAGGSEVLVDGLASRLRQRGHDVTLLCGGPVGSHDYETVRNSGTYSQYVMAPVRYAARFRDVDLVVETINGMPFFSPLWRRGPRLALITHLHTDQWSRYFPAPIARTARLVERSGLPLAYRNTHFLAISESTATDLHDLGIDKSRVHVMRLAATVDPSTVAPPSVVAERSTDPTFVVLGRLAPNKRLDLLLELWRRVEPHTAGRLVIVGDGPERARLEERVRSKPAFRNVVFEGRVTEARKAQLLRDAWLLVHTAEREGFGLVIPEAGLCGVPALAYDVPGVRDAVQNGVTGVLVKDHDEFVHQWIALGRDNERRARLGARAVTFASELSWDRSVGDFLDAASAARREHAQVERRTKAPARAFLSVAVGDALRATMHDTLPVDVETGAPRRDTVEASGPSKAGIRRSVELLQLFRRESVEPDRFYTYLAADTLRHVRRYHDPSGIRAIDIGGGPGYIAQTFKAAGAKCTVVEHSREELRLHDRVPDGAVQGDGQVLPIRDASVGLVMSSNVLEHVPDWRGMLSEMVRVLEPGDGLGYLTFTNWFSPWGGHETSPWHYAGGRRAVDRYERRYGRRPKNEYGVSLHRLHIAQVLRWFRQRPDVEVLWTGSRYLPEWMRWIARVPGIREVVTWNLVVVFRRRADTTRPVVRSTG